MIKTFSNLSFGCPLQFVFKRQDHLTSVVHKNLVRKGKTSEKGNKRFM